MATKAEKTILGELLEEVRGHRVDRQAQGETLARLDERTLAIQKSIEDTSTGIHGRIDETTANLHGRIDGVEERSISKINRRSAAVGAVVASIVGVIVTFAFAAMGWPRG